MRCGEGDALECLFWHGYGSMKCQNETVSTWVCRCHHISLHVCKTQHAPSTLELETWSSCRLKCSSSRLSVLLNGNVLDSQHQKPKRTILTTFYGRSQQRDCVCQRPCTSGPHIHLCDHNSSHFSVSHCAPLHLSSVSVSATCRTAPGI